MQQETDVSGFIFALLSTTLNTAVAWLAFLLRIYEISGSNVGPETIYSLGLPFLAGFVTRDFFILEATSSVY
jgi:hypothetical protein